MRVALFGAVGIGNLGNDASAQAMVAMLRSQDSAVQIVVISRGSPAGDLFGVPVLSFAGTGSVRRHPASRITSKLGDLRRLMKLVEGCDLVVVPGTGLLEEPQRRLPGGDLTWLLLVSLACAVRRVPLAWFSLGGAARMSVIPRLLAASAARVAGYRSFRDRMTARSLGRRVGRGVVVPDVVFSHPGIEQDDAHVPAATPTVAVAVIDYDPGDEETKDRYVTELTSAVAGWVGQGRGVRFVVGDSADLRHAERVRDRVAGLHPQIAVPAVEPLGDLDTLVSHLRAADVVVASRYHVLVAAALAGRPMIAVSHADKDGALMDSLGLSGQVLPARSFTAGELAARTDEVLATNSEMTRRIVAQVSAFRAAVWSEFRRSGVGSREGVRP